MLNVLVADDDANVLESVSLALTQAGHRVTGATDGGQAMDLLSSRAFDLAICDVQMPKLDGMSIMRRIRREAPATRVVLMTSYGRIADAVESLTDAAVDYVTKPFDPDTFARDVVGPIARQRSYVRNMDAVLARVVTRPAPTMIAVSPAMQKLVDRVSVLASSDASVLVVGDRGTGKELVARALHTRGSRRAGPYVVLDADLLGRVLARDWVEFHEQATGRDAWVEHAMGGTLVLDGIDDLPVAAQAHLLQIVSEPRAIAGRGVDGQPRGLRLVTLARATLGESVRAGDFCGSLFAWLGGVTLEVPSLDERADDLRPLVAELLGELAPGALATPELSTAAWEVLSRRRFAGNVRELRWALELALARSRGGPVGVEHLPPQILDEA